MSIEITLSEGPNIIGLAENRDRLYIGYCYRDHDLIWRVIEGKRIGTPATYKLHIGTHGAPLQEAAITRFEYTPQETTIEFLLDENPGKLVISNTKDLGRYQHKTIDEEIENVYNFFGEISSSPML